MVEPDDIILAHLHHICGALDEMRNDAREIIPGESQYADMSNRLNRMDFRIERIERRLDLTGA
jgi:hypothetical protein